MEEREEIRVDENREDESVEEDKMKEKEKLNYKKMYVIVIDNTQREK